MSRLLRVSAETAEDGSSRHQTQPLAVDSLGEYHSETQAASQSSPEAAHGLIPVSGGLWAIVSPEDFPLLSRHKWSLANRYPATEVGRLRVRMHSLVCPRGLAQRHLVVDHINRNPLDNRRENLRLVSQQLNAVNQSLHKNNRSGFAGVHRYRDKFRAKIRRHGKDIYLGLYSTPDAAGAVVQAFYEQEAMEGIR